MLRLIFILFILVISIFLIPVVAVLGLLGWLLLKKKVIERRNRHEIRTPHEKEEDVIELKVIEVKKENKEKL